MGEIIAFLAKNGGEKWSRKDIISSIFYFDRVSDSQMAHVLGGNTNL